MLLRRTWLAAIASWTATAWGCSRRESRSGALAAAIVVVPAKSTPHQPPGAIRPSVPEFRANIVREDPEAQRVGVAVRSETWARFPAAPNEEGRMGQRNDSGPPRELYFVGPSREVLESYLEGLWERDPTFRPQERERFVFGPTVDDGKQPWRTHRVDDTRAIEITSVVRATIETPIAQVILELEPDDAKQLLELTTGHVGRRVLIMIGDEVLNEPIVEEPLTQGRLSIVPKHGVHGSTEQAEALLRRLFPAKA